MKEYENISQFRLSTGGLFYRLLLQCKLIEKDQYEPWRRIVIFSVLTWLPLLVMTAIDGTMFGGFVDIPFLSDPVPHCRFLVSLPLLFIADRTIDPSVAYAVRHFKICDLVPDESDSNFRKTVDRLIHQRDMLWVDVILFAMAIAMVWIVIIKFSGYLPEANTSSWIYTIKGSQQTLTPAGWWLAFVSSPFMLFVLFRWIWRMIIWIQFLNRVSHLRLILQPTHPDQMGGLGPLSSAQFSFGILFSTVGVMMSSTLANDIIHAGRGLEELQWEILGFVLICIAIITSPLCTFFTQLFDTKRIGLGNYSTLAYKLSEKFQIQWIEKKNVGVPGGSSIAGVSPSDVADYKPLYDTVSNMRLIPLKKNKLVSLIAILVMPFIPLVFTQISMGALARRLIEMLI